MAPYSNGLSPQCRWRHMSYPQRQFGCPFCLPGTLAEYLLFQNYTALKVVRSVLLKGILCQDTFQFGI